MPAYPGHGMQCVSIHLHLPSCGPLPQYSRDTSFHAVAQPVPLLSPSQRSYCVAHNDGDAFLSAWASLFCNLVSLQFVTQYEL